jgi:hypothetical protein
LAKRLSEKEKIQMVQSFTQGETLDELANKFYCTKLTISRNLKKTLGEQKYKELICDNKAFNKSFCGKEKNISLEKETSNKKKSQNEICSPDFIKESNLVQDFFSNDSFMELTPLDFDVDNNKQKDLSSIPLVDITLPKIVYMIVDKKIELVIKNLRDFPDWHFLSEDELKRKTIEIFNDLKTAKRFCNKEQKVIKVPNSEIFKIVAPALLSKGISRIINDNQLIAL